MSGTPFALTRPTFLQCVADGTVKIGKQGAVRLTDHAKRGKLSPALKSATNEANRAVLKSWGLRGKGGELHDIDAAPMPTAPTGLPPVAPVSPVSPVAPVAPVAPVHGPVTERTLPDAAAATALFQAVAVADADKVLAILTDLATAAGITAPAKAAPGSTARTLADLDAAISALGWTATFVRTR
jgi:hypothetical protein